MLAPAKSEYGGAGGRASPAPPSLPGYEKYLAQGAHAEIEMNRLDTDQLPLLTAPQGQPWASASNVSLGYSPYGTPVQEVPPVPHMPQTQDYRQASLHRPYPTGPSGYPPPVPRPQQEPSGEMNMAGRGARRNMY
jgi:calcium permeable stress-gated cation channel